MSSPLQERIQAFLAGGPWAVVGASTVRAKYGNKVLRCYQQSGKHPVYPIHRNEREIEGLPAYASLAATPTIARAISFITPPKVTEGAVEEALALGIRHFWMQPGAESRTALARLEAAGLEPIAGGACLLVVLGFRE